MHCITMGSSGRTTGREPLFISTFVYYHHHDHETYDGHEPGVNCCFFALLFAFVLLCFTIGREAGRVGAFYYSCMHYFSGSGVSQALFIGRTGPGI
jgi:hypothetical protein